MGVRATRALVGAFGAGISLAVASSLMLLVVSSVIAFKGWPDDLSGAAEPEMAALLGAAASSAPAEPVVVALPRPAAPSISTGDRDGAAPGIASAGSEPSSSGGVGEQTSPSGTATSGSAPLPGDTSGVPADTDPAGQVGAAVGEVTDAVRDTTSAVAGTVAPVAPSVGGALQSVGAAGADTVDGAAQQLVP